MNETEERVSLLESLTEKMLISIDRLSREMREFKDEMREFKDEMREFKVEMGEFKDEMLAFKAESERDRKRMNKAWGDLANKLGSIVEDIAAPNIRRLATEEFRVAIIEDFQTRACRTSRRGSSRRAEFDVICAGAEIVLLGEMKSNASSEAVTAFARKAEQFFDFFPEYDGRRLVSIFASWSLTDAVRKAVSELGLYGIAMGDETMEIVARPAGVN